MKHKLIHWLGGYTKRELDQRQLKEIEEQAFLRALTHLTVLGKMESTLRGPVTLFRYNRYRHTDFMNTDVNFNLNERDMGELAEFVIQDV